MPAHEVAIVMNPAFSEELAEVASRMHVWILGTPTNCEASQRAWSAYPGNSLERGVTTIKPGGHENAEDLFTAMLGTIDEHHGEYSHDPPWTVLHIYGVKPVPEVLNALAYYGATQIDAQSDHFIATRVLPA